MMFQVGWVNEVPYPIQGAKVALIDKLALVAIIFNSVHSPRSPRIRFRIKLMTATQEELVTSMKAPDRMES